jgi:Alpha amylase, C-terminal all-beta domain
LFGLHYAFSDSFILPLPHHEVADRKGSFLGRIPGDAWQRFANPRACYAFMFGHPGKKLLFMGSEFGHVHEWRPGESVDWRLLELPLHRGLQTLVRDLNNLHRSLPALHELDCEAAGFEWIVMHDADRSVYAWLRKGRSPAARCLVVVNFTPEVRRDYAVGVPLACDWRLADRPHRLLDRDANAVQHFRMRFRPRRRDQCGQRGAVKLAAFGDEEMLQPDDTHHPFLGLLPGEVGQGVLEVVGGAVERFLAAGFHVAVERPQRPDDRDRRAERIEQKVEDEGARIVFVAGCGAALFQRRHEC